MRDEAKKRVRERGKKKIERKKKITKEREKDVLRPAIPREYARQDATTDQADENVEGITKIEESKNKNEKKKN